MNIKFKKYNNFLLLIYSPEQTDWIHENILAHGFCSIISSLFIITAEDILIKSNEESLYSEQNSLIIKIGELNNDKYFEINKTILNIDFNLYLHEDLNIDIQIFKAPRNISIFKRINSLKIMHDLYIGGDKQTISLTEFKTILKKFPNSYHLNLYSQAILDNLFKNFFDFKKDATENYESYINRKDYSPLEEDLREIFKEQELLKYRAIKNKIIKMLESDISLYSEHQWQEEILSIVLLLYPQYIHVTKSVKVEDHLDKKKTRNRHRSRKKQLQH